MSAYLNVHNVKSIKVARARDHGNFCYMTLEITHEQYGKEQILGIEVYSDQPLVIEGAEFQNFVTTFKEKA